LKHLQQIQENLNWQDMKENEILVKTVGPHALILVGEGKATIYSVLWFLQHVLGYTLSTENNVTVKSPISTTPIQIDELNIRQILSKTEIESFDRHLFLCKK